MRDALLAPVHGDEVQDLLLTEFRRAADLVPGYRTLLDEHGVRADQVCDLGSFSRLCPLLSKSNTFERFTLAKLSVGGALHDVADVLTSSGHGGRFSFGVISRREAARGPDFADAAMDAAFGVTSRTTLAINCLPMGVVFSSRCMTVATTSVREDMVVALVEAAGDQYEQIILVGDPLFMKRLTDHAVDRAIDWRRYHVNVLLGEETFGEHFRGYLATCFGLDLDHPEDGHIMSSFGVGELGLHLCFETTATIALRRAASANPAFARDLFGGDTGTRLPLPMIFTFSPHRTFIEAVEPDRDGYGRMAISMLDAERSMPLLRYQTGDVIRLLDRELVAAVVRRHGICTADGLPPLLALQGRSKDALPNDSRIAVYKDALYADHALARHLTGAFRLIFSGRHCSMHVQLVQGQTPHADLQSGILRAMVADVRPARLVLWPYATFPFGMGLDYERKFSHYVSGEPDVESCEP